MKYYSTIILLLVSFGCFGQFKPISEIKTGKLSKKALGVTSLFGENGEGNTVVVHSSKSMYVSILDDSLKEIRGKRIEISNLNQQYDEYFQDEKNIYRFYGNYGGGTFSKRPSPKGMTINKETFSHRFERLLALEEDEYYCGEKVINDELYLVTFFKKKSTVKIYKLKGFDIVDKFEFVDERFSKLKDFFLRKVGSHNIFFQNNNLYIVQKSPVSTNLRTTLLKFDLSTNEYSYKSYLLQIEDLHVETAKFPEPGSKNILKLYTAELIGNELLVLFRANSGFYICSFDLESGELLNSKNLVNKSGPSNIPYFHSTRSFDFTEMILKSKISLAKIFNKKNMRFGLGGGSSSFLDIIYSNENKSVMVFGKRRMEIQNSPGAMVPVGGGMTMGLGGGTSNLGYKTDFCFVEYDAEKFSFQPIPGLANKISSYFRYYQYDLTKYVNRKRQRAEDISFTRNGVRMVSFDRERQEITIY